MGNQQSIIQNIQAQVQQQNLAATQNAAAAAAAAEARSGAFKQQKRTELNMAKADVIQKQKEYDDLTPDEALNRKTDEGNKEAERVLTNFDASFTAELRVYNRILDEIRSIANSPAFRLAQKYKKDLEHKYKEVQYDNSKFKEYIATNRRRFLDNDPQERVDGIFGFSSIDDRIYMLFWACFLLFIIPISHHIMVGLGSTLISDKQWIYIWIGVNVALCIIADQALRRLA